MKKEIKPNLAIKITRGWYIISAIGFILFFNSAPAGGPTFLKIPVQNQITNILVGIFIFSVLFAIFKRKRFGYYLIMLSLIYYFVQILFGLIYGTLITSSILYNVLTLLIIVLAIYLFIGVHKGKEYFGIKNLAFWMD